jgi:TolB-like protein
MVQERPVRVERRLSAILAADVAGYSRLMHRDEEVTHARLRALLAESVEPAVAEHGGRIVKNTGDGFLAEFSSAVEAVRAAMQFQNRISELTIDDHDDARIAFRVGINIGDVIVEPHDIFGDDVNIAARLESVAEPGGICISSSAYAHVRGKLALEFADLGEQNLKNIELPVRAYAMVLSRTAQAERVPSPPRLSIVVLPFTNLGGDREQDYFVDGVTESLTTDLSRISGSFVIGRHTAFTFKDKGVDLQRLGRELNIRYVLEGSMQRAGSRMRVNVQLTDVESGNHVWAERFDKPVIDMFDMQDEIVSRLANAFNTQIIEAEARRAECKLHPDTIDLYFQGRACLHKGLTKEHLAQARGFFERALALDPANIDALVGTARIDFNTAANFFADDRGAFLAAETVLLEALSRAPQHAHANLLLGAVHIYTGRATQGIAECEQALAMDRNLAGAHAMIGMAKNMLGRSDESEAHIQEALRLSPRDIFAHRWMMFAGVGKLWNGDDAEAVTWLRRSIEHNRNFPLAHFHLAAALALVGSLDDARAAANAGLMLDRAFTIRRYRANALSKNSNYLAGRQRSYKGMRMAGVPEG